MGCLVNFFAMLLVAGLIGLFAGGFVLTCSDNVRLGKLDGIKSDPACVWIVNQRAKP